MPTFRDLLDHARAGVEEVSVLEARQHWRQGWTFLDVREGDEIAQGVIEGAVTIPRGNLELQVEARIPDKNTKIVVYCAGGVRSIFATKTLIELGYSRVASLEGGFERWKNEQAPWTTPASLTPPQRIRYHRHLLLSEIGEQGQKRLLDSRVLILGAGGLGSPAALYLGAAGVGTLGIIDMDVVEASNLQRQIIHSLDRIGVPKVDSARTAIEALNPDVRVISLDQQLQADNILEVFQGYDVIVDATDNFPTRYLVNDASLVTGIPVVYGSILRFEGQVTVFDPFHGPCYRCLVPEPPPADLAPSCAEAGVLGVLPGVIGSLQALETIKLLLSLGESLVGHLLTYNALDQEFRKFRFQRNPACKACQRTPQEIELSDYDNMCAPHPTRTPLAQKTETK